MEDRPNMLRTIVYVVIAIILIAIALRILGWILNLALHVMGIILSLVFLVGLIYVIYLILRGAYKGQ